MCCFAALCYAIPTPHAIFGKATWYEKFRSIITDVWLITGKCMFGSRAIRICIAMLPSHIEGDYLYNHPKPVFMEERTGFCGPISYCQTPSTVFFNSSRHPPFIRLVLSKIMLIVILLIVYGTVSADELFATTTISTVEDTISLQCLHGFQARSLVELVISCSRKEPCRALMGDDGETQISQCTCLMHFAWPMSTSYILSSIYTRRVRDPLPGTPVIYVMVAQHLCSPSRVLNEKIHHRFYPAYTVLPFTCIQRNVIWLKMNPY